MADKQAKYNQIRKDDESITQVKEQILAVNVTDGALGKKEAGVPGDSADQQAEAQCEEDGAAPSNEVSGLTQEAKRVTVDEYNPTEAYGETVNKTQDDLIKDRQAELTATT